MTSSANDRTKKEFVLGATTLLARGDSVELMTCRQYLESHHPDRGVKLVEIVIDALSPPCYVSGKYYHIDWNFPTLMHFGH
jgi:hypothetical protein